jgi:hypothetical protein
MPASLVTTPLWLKADFSVNAENERRSLEQLLQRLEELGEVMRSYAESVLGLESGEAKAAPASTPTMPGA